MAFHEFIGGDVFRPLYNTNPISNYFIGLDSTLPLFGASQDELLAHLNNFYFYFLEKRCNETLLEQYFSINSHQYSGWIGKGVKSISNHPIINIPNNMLLEFLNISFMYYWERQSHNNSIILATTLLEDSTLPIFGES